MATQVSSFERERTLTRQNIDIEIVAFLKEIEQIGNSLGGFTGIPLFEILKRGKVGLGPYPGVSLFEAANRVMTDLVVLYGVRWLLNNADRGFPFSSYTIDFGNENNNPFDITAAEGENKLIGEAFNVSPSFFHGKKSSMLEKIREKGVDASHRIVMFNHDAMPNNYRPKNREAVHIFVHVGNGAADIL